MKRRDSSRTPTPGPCGFSGSESTPRHRPAIDDYRCKSERIVLDEAPGRCSLGNVAERKGTGLDGVVRASRPYGLSRAGPAVAGATRFWFITAKIPTFRDTTTGYDTGARRNEEHCTVLSEIGASGTHPTIHYYDCGRRHSRIMRERCDCLRPGRTALHNRAAAG